MLTKHLALAAMKDQETSTVTDLFVKKHSESKETQEFLESLFNNKMLRERIRKLVSSPTDDAVRSIIRRSIVERFLSVYVERNGKTFDENKFKELFDELDAHVHDKSNFVYNAPVLNLRLAEDITLSDVTLKKLDPTDSLFRRSGQLFGSSIIRPLDPECMFEATAEKYELQKMHDRFQTCIDILNLFTPSPTALAYVGVITPTFYHAEQAAATEVRYPRGVVWSSTATLDKAAAREFVAIYEKFKKMSPHPKLLFAIKRFNYGRASFNKDDKILEFVLALEALFSNSRTEITQQLSLRIAVMHMKALDETKTQKKFMICVYDIRSTIVHGAYHELEEKIRKMDAKDKDWLLRLEEITRKSIIAYIYLVSDMQKGFEQIIPLIDDSIIEQSMREQIRKIGRLS
jgi:hypothetical protein